MWTQVPPVGLCIYFFLAFEIELELGAELTLFMTARANH